MLWLCLNLPFLPLEVSTRVSDVSGPFAVSEGEGRTHRVLIANEAAMRGGIRPGMPLQAAHALVSRLKVVERDEVSERAALERLAAWAGQFTSHVSLASPRTLLLEIEGSLNLFGGLKRLRHTVRSRIRELGYSAVLSVAPTPLAATWFANAMDEEPISDLPALAGRLFDLPLDALGLAPTQHELLRSMGLATLGECLRLPRDGLARRLGTDVVTAIDRAFGRLPDPRAFYAAPSSFEASVAFPGPVDNTESVLFPLHRLLLELSGFLTARVAGVQTLELRLLHSKAPATRIALGLARATRDTRHLGDLFRERLAHTALPEPVEEIVLQASQLQSLTATETDFFAPRYTQPHAAAELIERLTARLGREAVRGLSAAAEHRPERAWRYIEPGDTAMQEAPAERPLWLLQRPVALEMRDGQPCFDGALALEVDRERIESGWWDGQDMRRDYFIASDAVGSRLWIYRELSANSRWWLHGVFG